MKFLNKRIAALSLMIVATIMLSPIVHAKKAVAVPSLVSPDDNFMALRDAARHDDAARAAQIADRLADYPIPSYIEYYRLKPRIKSASAREILEFLNRYEGSAIADRLRNDWLLDLGYKRSWEIFDEHYPKFVVNDDTQVKCYALISRAIKGQNVANDARELLVSPKDYGEACRTLIVTLMHAGQFDAKDLWAQVRLAAESGTPGAAPRIAALANVAEKQVSQAVDRPLLTLAKKVGKTQAEHELFVIALGRMAKTSLELAERALSGAGKQLTPEEIEQGWAQIALQASLKLAPEAADYWKKAGDAPLSTEGFQWRVRIALRAGDWKMVKSGIEAMPPTLRANPAWTYWMGRALKAEGRQEEAQKLFRSVADEVHFYGQLATEELGQKIVVKVTPANLTPADMAPIASNPGFRRALKFFDMNLRFEGVREWNWELRKMNDREHLAAAEFARQNNLLDRMVNTSDRTKSELDFTQRYPTPFREFMYSSTNALGLDMAWVYGLIRQESRFIMNAKSSVGASGLMQLMPATASFVARKIGIENYHHGQVNDVNINIQLGTNYLNMVLADLDGSQVMASAAYNAGPGRPRAWRSTLKRNVEGAIFAESIPFNETRGYVKNVLSNATYYAALFEGKPQSLKARLGTVAPKGYVQTDLP
ncbi:lytic transglycosylase domain-containing protein [soil metagenome]